MQNDALTLYKLIILYILDKVNFPLTNAQISNFILEKEYTNYFTIQQAISELNDAELIRTETIRNSTYYRINQAGEETLEFFGNKVSDAIKSDIDEYLSKNEYELRDEVSTIADYYEEKKDEYIVRCQVKENGSPIIDLSISVPSEQEAVSICNNWKSKSQEVYAYIMKTLMFHSND
ncbi:uncharacterized protein DUF4364 [Mobilisporobacter senegalensis]|uniref:Uncharacterized protein DUF4364 n=1 Tax=Mobilisporobacter senegalensis TaxID=1329262 RepID=A0A3N1XU15_9FIRM|nr:DUF4364 family protein [Mobilisporobacter senegalensis]ROR28672.1 uncharacterized protein DUF4364 [Mobilisporobacter senegalensis]